MRLNVLYQFNEKYAPYAGISMISLMENNKSADKIVIYILGENLTLSSKEKLTKQAQSYGCSIHFINTEKIIKRICQLGIPKYRGSYATNMKMFVTDCLDADIDRLLYVDSDTIICGELDPLFSLDMDNKPIAMVLDSLGRTCRQAIGLSESDYYFNGGVILYDVKKWRQDKCTEKIQEHAQNIRAGYVSPDQDLLNVVLRKQIKKLDASYNLQPIHTVYTYRQYCHEYGEEMYYSEAEINAAVANPKILHAFRYLGEFPWHKNSLHPYRAYFDQYMELSLWKDYQKQPTEQNGVLFRIEKLLYRHLPKSIFLKIFKLSHEFFILKSNRDLQNKKINMHKNFQDLKTCIYVIGHKKFTLPAMDSIYIPLVVGNQYGAVPEGWLSDQTGENISDKNYRYNELTGLYWIWKNSDAEIAGLCHYRRFFTTSVGKIRNVLTGRKDQFINEDYIKKVLDSYDVILHNRTFTLGGNQKHVCINKKDSKETQNSKLGIEVLELMNNTFKKVYPEDEIFYQKIMNRRYAHLLNIFICPKSLLDQYCEWLFPLLYAMEQEIDRQFPGQTLPRCMGLIAERLLDVWILKKKLRVKECFTINTEKIEWKPW